MIDILNNISLPQSSSISPINRSVDATKKRALFRNTDLNEEAVRLTLSPAAQKLLKDPATKKNSKENSEKTISENKLKLSEAELKTVQKLQGRDVHVKMHEQQHMAVAGAYAVGGPHYQFTMGPDGKSYAVGGEVQLDTNPVSNNPEATIHKAEIIRQGALAPADPSGADRSVAATATQMEAKARAELAKKSNPESSGTNTATTKTNLETKAKNSKIQAYKNFLHPSYPGQFINQSS